MSFVQKNYSLHKELFQRSITVPEYIERAKTWFDESTADFWRHKRCYEFLDAFEKKYYSWLTVGDGRWGLDSIRIRKRGFAKVLPTDISEHLLALSKEQGYISQYKIENAEKLSFVDDSFDYVFCKESFHHFPRPYLALYEMLRVARRGVFLIEPNDKALTMFSPADFEEVGNFVYRISRNEARKVALGMGLRQLVFNGLNDHYIKGVEFEPADLEKSEVFREVVTKVRIKDELCRQGDDDYSMLQIGFMKIPLDKKTMSRLQIQGWWEAELPQNPYT